jgi:hypothetical protein
MNGGNRERGTGNRKTFEPDAEAAGYPSLPPVQAPPGTKGNNRNPQIAQIAYFNRVVQPERLGRGVSLCQRHNGNDHGEISRLASLARNDRLS